MQGTHSRIGVILLTGAAALSAGCKRNETAAAAPTIEPAAVIVVPAQLTIEAGSTAALAAQANDTRGEAIGGASLHFAATDNQLLRVTDLGQVTALGPVGRTVVRVTSATRERLVPVTIIAGPASRIEKVRGDGQTARAGEAPARPLVVRLVDQFGNPIAGRPLTATLPDRSQTQLNGTTAANGRAMFTLPAITKAGSLLLPIHAGDDAALTTEFELSVQPAAPTAIVPFETPPDGVERSSDGHEIVVEVRDTFGNPVPGAVVQWNLEADAGRLESVETPTGDDGRARTHWFGDTSSAESVRIGASVAGTEHVRIALVFKPAAIPAGESQASSESQS